MRKVELKQEAKDNLLEKDEQKRIAMIESLLLTKAENIQKIDRLKICNDKIDEDINKISQGSKYHLVCDQMQLEERKYLEKV